MLSNRKNHCINCFEYCAKMPLVPCATWTSGLGFDSLLTVDTRVTKSNEWGPSSVPWLHETSTGSTFCSSSPSKTVVQPCSVVGGATVLLNSIHLSRAVKAPLSARIQHGLGLSTHISLAGNLVCLPFLGWAILLNNNYSCLSFPMANMSVSSVILFRHVSLRARIDISVIFPFPKPRLPTSWRQTMASARPADRRAMLAVELTGQCRCKCWLYNWWLRHIVWLSR